MVKAVIFDFDGVVVDSQKYWDTETIEVYRHFLPGWTLEDDVRMRGRNLNDAYDILVARYGLTAPRQDFFREITNFAYSIYESRAQVLDGFPELLAQVRGAQLPVGMASSGERDWIKLALKRLELEGVFDPIVTAKDVGAGKPDPAVYLEAARRMGCDPAACIAVEDSRNGVSSAKAAGMFCVGLRHKDSPMPEDLSHADIVVANLREVDLGKLLA